MIAFDTYRAFVRLSEDYGVLPSGCADQLLQGNFDIKGVSAQNIHSIHPNTVLKALNDGTYAQLQVRPASAAYASLQGGVACTAHNLPDEIVEATMKVGHLL